MEARHDVSGNHVARHPQLWHGNPYKLRGSVPAMGTKTTSFTLGALLVTGCGRGVSWPGGETQGASSTGASGGWGSEGPGASETGASSGSTGAGGSSSSGAVGSVGGSSGATTASECLVDTNGDGIGDTPCGEGSSSGEPADSSTGGPACDVVQEACWCDGFEVPPEAGGGPTGCVCGDTPVPCPGCVVVNGGCLCDGVPSPNEDCPPCVAQGALCFCGGSQAPPEFC